MIINARQLLEKIRKGRALCAFNFSTLEIAEAIVKTASRLKTPVILQTSSGEVAFLGPEIAVAISRRLAEKYQLSLALNLDHAQNLELIKECIEIGYSSIHADGSRLSFEENINFTKKVVDLCHSRQVSVEGEIGIIPGHSVLVQKIQPETALTDPESTPQFIKATGVDFLAVSIGEKHGLAKTDLQFELLNKIVRLIEVPLVLHGGSGIPRQDLQKAIDLGIRKVIFNTELRLAWTEGLKRFLGENPQEIVPYKILPASQSAVARVVEEKIKICSL